MKSMSIFNRITFVRIIRNRSTEQFSGIPYVLTLLNCLLSTWYAFGFFSFHLRRKIWLYRPKRKEKNIYACSYQHLTLILSNRYGLPFVSPNNILVSTINGAGAALEVIYVIIFITFAPRKEKVKILGLFALVITIFATVALVSIFALHVNTRKLFCGLAASVFSIIMYGSALSIMVRNHLWWNYHLLKCKTIEIFSFILGWFSYANPSTWLCRN